MVEPQEHSASAKVIKAQERFVEEAFKEGEAIPEEMINASLNKMATFMSLKHEINSKMGEVHERLASIKRLMKSNFRNRNNPDGLLNRDET